MNSRAVFDTTLPALVCLLVLGATALQTGVAHADCKPVIAAYGKADATKRYAIYAVDSLDQAPKGAAITIVIGDVKYTEHDVQKGPLNIVMDGYTKGGAAPGSDANALRTDEQKGKMKCAPLPQRKVAGEAASGYHVGSADRGSGSLDPFGYDIWVSVATGLPIVNAPESSTGGFRYVYGNQVVAPTPDKIRN
jgi:hypothetical protein